MKNISPLSTLTLGLSAALGATLLADDEWTVTLIQRQLETGGTFSQTVEATGEGLSSVGVPEGGSEFNLWATRDTATGPEAQLIDTEVVGAYLPNGTLSITTEDPYTGGIPRTRIDRGFTLNYEVGGLITDASITAPTAAKSVLLDHTVALNEAEVIEVSGLSGSVSSVTEVVYGDLLPSEEFSQQNISENGANNLAFPSPNIPGMNPLVDAGVETFRLFALADGNTAQLQLDEAQVQIWPMAEATIIGLEEGEEYLALPEVTVTLTNLYPDSETWVQIYPGPSNPGTVGTRLDESTIVVNDDVPRSTRLVFRDLNEIVRGNDADGDEGGPFTMEVLTSTPFGVEIIQQSGFNLSDGTLTVRASIQTLTN